MRKLLTIFLLSANCFAVKQLSSSLPFTDAQGNPIASGYLVFNLSSGAKNAGGEVVPVPPIQILLGANGTVIGNTNIIANDEMTPTGTYYIVRVFNSNNVLVRGPEKWILSGASPIDISLMVDVSIPDPGLASPVLQNPIANQTITGFPLFFDVTAPPEPVTAGATDLGSAALPWGNLWLGGLAGSNVKVTAVATAARTATFPDATGTVSYPVMQDCTTTTACANTVKSNWFIVRGDVTFPTATTVSLSQLPFTSASSYSCTASDLTTAAGVVNATTYTSGAAVTFTETGGTNTDHARYICVGF